MLGKILLPDPTQLELESWYLEDQILKFYISATQSSAACPDCQSVSVRVHSRYQRTLGDLRCVSFRFQLHWTIRRFFCDNEDCQRVTFAEQIPTVADRYARKTRRLTEQQSRIAHETGGEPGARLVRYVSDPLSADTLLRLIRDTPEDEIETPRVLGVDDWAFRKGHHYGTILVDLEARRPVDLLPERSAEALETWLKEHPGIEIISRDRGSEYIKGATDGAPDAIQVADRWHLLKNLRDALERFLETKSACLRAAAEEEPDNETVPSNTEISATNDTSLTKDERQKDDRRVKRIARFETVKELHAYGFTQRAIAEQLGMCKRTVRKYIEAESCPCYPEGRRSLPGKIAPYMAYLEQQWKDGHQNATQLWREICEMGFTGSRGLVAQWAAKQREPSSAAQTNLSSKKVRPLAPSRAVWLLIKDTDALSSGEQQALQRMKETDEKLAFAHTLGQDFFKMVRQRRQEELDEWIDNASDSGIAALKGFANGIKQDIDAVRAALSLEWSNGQVEGQVNRLKLIKRQMYGRANFDLLRKRVLGWPASPSGP